VEENKILPICELASKSLFWYQFFYKKKPNLVLIKITIWNLTTDPGSVLNLLELMVGSHPGSRISIKPSGSNSTRFPKVNLSSGKF
jgi:hypothetical protein